MFSAEKVNCAENETAKHFLSKMKQNIFNNNKL